MVCHLSAMESLAFFTKHLQEYLAELRALTEIETPTRLGTGLERAADFLSQALQPFGRLEREDLPTYGPLLRLVRPGTGARVLLLAHYDTVWAEGSWPTLWRVDGGRVFGPGVYDMKGGLLFVLWLLRYLDGANLTHPHLEVLLNPDEELGSLASRRHIEDAARRADFVLVLEPTNGDGAIKLARKGSGEYVVRIKGRATHQGVEPESGTNAVVEAAHQIIRLLELANDDQGTTVGPNVIAGGSASNMVADCAEMLVDVRTWSRMESERLETAFHNLRPVLEGIEIEVSGGWNRPPMEPTPATFDLYKRIVNVGGTLGLDLPWVRWGGSSDANLAAAVGTATVDGLGPVGAGAHQIDEHIIVDAVPVRLALLADLVVSLAVRPEEWLSPEALASMPRRT
jgi:glutamate carboxypeptidase